MNKFNRFDNKQKMFGIYKHEEYSGNPIFNLPKNNSTYYNYNIDTQCSVPGRCAQEILNEMKINT